MAEPFLGQIQTLGFTFAPRGWANCDGQLLPISQYSALFSLFGTTYGGDGRTTFGLPDLRGRVPIHVGNGPGLTPRTLGTRGGVESVTLTVEQIAQHTHSFAPRCNTGDATSDEPQNNFAAKTTGGETIYAAAPTADVAMGGGTTGAAGGSRSHDNMQPFLVIRFCVALQGLFPSRS